jgi:hypothetical protein
MDSSEQVSNRLTYVFKELCRFSGILLCTRERAKVKLAAKTPVLFARIGWMKYYNGPQSGDEKPTGGGKYNKANLGHEVFNFHEISGQLFGYFQPQMRTQRIALERVGGFCCNGSGTWRSASCWLVP